MRAFAPIRPNADKRGKTVRLFSSPRYARPSRKHPYVAVEQAAQVTADAASAFTVTVGGETATLRPLKRRQGALVKSEVRPGGRFGWLLNADGLDDVLDWQLTVSAGGQITDYGAVLADYDGVKLGLWLRDWRAHGLTIDRSTGHVRIDVTKAKAMLQPGGVLDLDPTVVEHVGCTSIAKTSLASWAGACFASEGDEWYPILAVGQYASVSTPYRWWCCRAMMKFDTTEFPGAVAAKLKYQGYVYGNDLHPEDLFAAHATFTEGDWDLPDYGALRTAAGGAGAIGYMSPMDGEGYSEVDVLAQYVEETEWGIGFTPRDDMEGNPPTPGAARMAYMFVFGEPWLEVTLPGDPSLSTPWPVLASGHPKEGI